MAVLYPGDRSVDTINDGREFLAEGMTVRPPLQPGGPCRISSGGLCPCCDRPVQLRPRKVPYQSAMVLMELYYYHLNPGDPYWDWYTNHPKFMRGYMHLPTLFKRHPEDEIKACQSSREHGRMKLWKLIRSRQQDKKDGKRPMRDTRSGGYYRITTQLGVEFVTNTNRVIPRWCWVFRNKVKFRSNGRHPDIPIEMVNIEAALGENFHYEEIFPPGCRVETVSEILPQGRDRYVNYPPPEDRDT